MEENRTAAEARLDALWLDYTRLRNWYNDLPHNAPDWERRSLGAQVDAALAAVRQAEAREREADAARDAQTKAQAAAELLRVLACVECGNISGGTAWWWNARLWVIGANGPVCPVCLRAGIATHAAQGESINWWGCGE